MTPIAISFLIVAVVIIWGGLVVSSIFLVKRPEIDHYPAGGDDPEHEAG